MRADMHAARIGPRGESEMIPPARHALLALVALLAFAPPALAQEPIHVSARASFATVTQGGFQNVECLIENTSGENILAHITVFVTYADGTVQAFRLQQAPVMLGPGDAFFLSIGFAVPQDAALGTATFSCSVRALGAGGGGFVQTATAPFEVVAG